MQPSDQPVSMHAWQRDDSLLGAVTWAGVHGYLTVNGPLVAWTETESGDTRPPTWQVDARAIVIVREPGFVDTELDMSVGGKILHFVVDDRRVWATARAPNIQARRQQAARRMAQLIFRAQALASATDHPGPAAAPDDGGPRSEAPPPS